MEVGDAQAFQSTKSLKHFDDIKWPPHLNHRLLLIVPLNT